MEFEKFYKIMKNGNTPDYFEEKEKSHIENLYKEFNTKDLSEEKVKKYKKFFDEGHEFGFELSVGMDNYMRKTLSSLMLSSDNSLEKIE